MDIEDAQSEDVRSLEWLSYELDGALDSAERAQLEADLSASAELREERGQLRKLDSLLAKSHVQVEPDFHARTMEALPAAGWESRHPRSWTWAVAALLLLGASSAALVGLGSAQSMAAGAGSGMGGAAFGAARAVLDLFATSALAGAGMLAASWKGIGVALGDLFAKPVSLVGLGVFVLLLNLLFLSLLRGDRRQAQGAAARSSNDR